ncbi:hypothetical protein SDC9_138144 [bioreactor metagenome]|uniref:SOS response-associated peptidase YedK n=1 Tax=bioreactor metagenome TaxID=1076179 RepID=A0A645DP03_9ZZZZ|nr:SOS response-associated peptidase family protein [Erysipelotrichaceae bacterium]
MCGRYLFNDHNSHKLQEIIDETKQKYEQAVLELVSWDEIYPSACSVVMIYQERLVPVLMNWGYPKWNSKNIIINARTEHIRDSQYFKDDYLRNRCVIACTGFYEWDQEKHRHFIKDPQAELIYLAGIYRIIDNKYYYCILTKEANEQMRIIHDRMPVVMDENMAIKYCLSAI